MCICNKQNTQLQIILRASRLPSIFVDMQMAAMVACFAELLLNELSGLSEE